MNAAAEPARDYLAEARRIAAGEGMVLAEAAHIQAALRYAAELTGNVQKLSELVCASVLDRDALEVLVPAGLIASVRQRRLSVFIETTPQGVLVHLFEPPRPAAQGSLTAVRS